MKYGIGILMCVLSHTYVNAMDSDIVSCSMTSSKSCPCMQRYTKAPPRIGRFVRFVDISSSDEEHNPTQGQSSGINPSGFPRSLSVSLRELQMMTQEDDDSEDETTTASPADTSKDSAREDETTTASPADDHNDSYFIEGFDFSDDDELDAEDIEYKQEANKLPQLVPALSMQAQPQPVPALSMQPQPQPVARNRFWIEQKDLISRSDSLHFNNQPTDNIHSTKEYCDLLRVFKCMKRDVEKYSYWLTRAILEAYIPQNKITLQYLYSSPNGGYISYIVESLFMKTQSKNALDSLCKQLKLDDKQKVVVADRQYNQSNVLLVLNTLISNVRKILCEEHSNLREIRMTHKAGANVRAFLEHPQVKTFYLKR